MAEPTAVVCTYLPDEQTVYHTTFTGADSVSRAQGFKESEQERDDFPGSIWGIIANEEAREAHSERIMQQLTGGKDE